MDAGLLRGALVRLGAQLIPSGETERLRFRMPGGAAYTLDRGVLSYADGNPNIADAIKVAYSRQVIAKVARDNRWTVRETAANAFEVAR